MHYIGVISDTHGLLREEVKEKLKQCDVILHGGDIHKPELIEALKAIAPLYAVRGNADKDWAEEIPIQLSVTLFGVPIILVHNKRDLNIPDDFKGLVVFGHSHRYMDKEEGGIHYLNPGSCGPRRFHQPITMVVIEVSDEGKYAIKKVLIPHEQMQESGSLPEKKQDARLFVRTVMKEIDRGNSVEKIAADHHLDPELTEQICRMYLTHPGVDVDGILDRLK